MPSTARRGFLVPFLFAVLPALYIADANPGRFALADLGVVLAASLALCGLFYGVAALLLRGPATRQLAPIAALALVGWVFLYRGIQRMASAGLGALGSHVVLVPAGIGVTIGMLWWLARRARVSENLSRALTHVGVALVVWSLLGIAIDQIRAARTVANSELRRRLHQPVVTPDSRAAPAKGAAPDLYLIILDERASSVVMRERFGHDGRAFEDSLRQLGFTIPRLVRSNYVHTTLSIASMLGFTHLTDLSEELGTEAVDPSLPNELLQDNRTASFLRSRGYRFVFFPSQWWPSTRHMRNADEEVDVWPRTTPSRALTRSDLRRNMRQLTPLGFTSIGDGSEYADYVRRTFQRLKDLPVSSQPRFILAHVVSPHPPVALDAHCQAVNGPDLVRANHPRTMPPYLDQVRCLDSLVLDLVNVLQTRSRKAPIILLQGDHGTNSLNYSSASSAEQVSSTQARERFGAFGAYFLPGSHGRLLADTVTPVNVFPSIFNFYFGTNLPLEPNHHFMSLEQSPYRFCRFELEEPRIDADSSASPVPPAAAIDCR